MPNTTYASWPFRPALARSIEEEAQWWSHCYLESEISRIVVGWPHWRVIVGGPGSGKSVLLAAVVRAEAQLKRSLIVHYPPSRWPGARQALVSDGNHLAQIMAAIALSLRDHLTHSLADIAQLTPGQGLALRWMLDRYLGSRAFTRWVDSLPDEIRQRLQGITYAELYTSTTAPAEVYGQIDEAVGLARRLGFERLLVVVDLNSREAQAQLSNLGELFSWLELMHQPGLALLAAVPDKAAGSIDLISHTRGRANVAHLTWEKPQMRTMAEQHLRAALADPTAALSQYVEPALLSALADRLQAEFDGIAPLSWVWLVETVLHHASQELKSLPLDLSQETAIWREFHARHLRLDLVKGRGVWRGPRFIPLDPQPLSLMELLWQKSTAPVNVDDPDISALLAGAKDKKGLLHTLARRVRRAIEPEPSHPIYLINDRGEGGYWLDNIVETSPLNTL